ncbi:MAG: hypothetical protein PHP65_00430 [Bacilli bacterium]|nr:hypothetical protein [Bacilli bacterium]
MAVSKNNAMKLWDDVFGANTLYAQDCFGTWMYKDDYGDYEIKRIRPNGDGKKYQYGWDVDHIRPKSDFEKESDAEFRNNYEPVHRNNNVEKADSYPHFEIDDLKYKIVRCSVCRKNGTKGYGIEDVSTNMRVDWKGVQGKCYE